MLTLRSMRKSCEWTYLTLARRQTHSAIRTFRSSTTLFLQWSYTRGPSDVQLKRVTIGSLLQNQVEKTPDREAVIFSSANIRKTFHQLLEESDHLAAGLSSLGLKKGDRVGIWGPNTVEWILTQYATARLGLILVNINPLFKKDELEFVLKRVQCSAIVSAVEHKSQNYYDILLELLPELANQKSIQINNDRLPDLKFIIMMVHKNYPGTIRFSDVLHAGSEKEMRAIYDLQTKLHCDDPINIQFTSGTTGLPKGATLSHHNIVNNSYLMGMRLGYHEKDIRICVPVPLYHCFGMVAGSLQMPSHGATCIFPNPIFNAEATLKAVETERCTTLYGVPTMFIDMLNHPDLERFDLNSLCGGLMGGTSCPIETMRQVIQSMHMPDIISAYGSTETSPVTFQCERDVEVEKRVITAGTAIPHVEGKIVDRNGDTAPVNNVGEIWTRGHTTMIGYWGDEQGTREVIDPDGWYKTGDLGTIDEDGFLRVTGRMKEMIIRGGENIYPAEIEQVLYTNPKIQEAQIVGVPDQRMGEAVCAWIHLKDGQSATEIELQNFCEDKMAKFKVPRYVFFVTDYPLTATGKVQKFKLRERAIKLLNLTAIIS